MKFLIALLFCFPMFALAQSSIERDLSATSKADNPADARKEILDQVQTKLTEDLTKDLIGDELFLKNHALILSKVVKQSARYLPLTKPGNLKKIPDGYEMDYKITANLAALRQVLHDQGLLNENSGASILLPLVVFRDDIHGSSDRWWIPSDKPVSSLLRNMEREFEVAIRAGFRKNGFYMMQPITAHLTPSVPRALYSENLGPEETQLMGDYFGAPLSLQGAIALRPAEGREPAHIDVKLQVYQAENHRTIADVARVYAVDNTSDMAYEKKWQESITALANDVAAQVFDAGQKGSIGSSQIRLTVEPRPALPAIENLKEKLRSSNVGLRDIHERLISSNAVTFEIESPVSASELATKLNNFQFDGHPMTATVEGTSEIKMRWQGGAQ